MCGGTERARQAIPRHGRLIPLAHPHALHVVQQLAPVEHFDRIAERKHLGLRGLVGVVLSQRRGGGLVRVGGCRARGAAGLVAGHDSSRMLVLVVVTPSSGSCESACIQAHARSAWLVSSERPA